MNNPLTISDITLPLGSSGSCINSTCIDYNPGYYHGHDRAFQDQLSIVLLPKVLDGTFTIEEADKILKNLTWK